MKQKDRNSILGLSFEGKSLCLCLMRRRGGRPQIEKSLRVPLVLDPLSNEAELVGREIRNQLDAAGIHERECAVCLPLHWMLALHTDLPDLNEEELDGFIALHAERSLPYAPEDMAIGVSRMKPSVGPGMATILAISRHSLASLQAVLKAARLKPVMFTPGVATLPLPATCAALLAGDGGLDLAVWHAGGFALIRSQEEALENGPDGAEWDLDSIARQLRISMGRLPQPVRDALRTVVVWGAAEPATELADGLREALGGQGLAVRDAAAEMNQQGIDPARWSQAAAVAACCLERRKPVFNLLPPHVSRFKQIAGRISARGAIYLGGGAILLVVILGALFAIQTAKLSRLEGQWNVMKPAVTRIEKIQAKVRTFRPWFDPSAASLAIMARIASAFPEAGSVWMKSLVIKDLGTVTCTCSARGNMDRLMLIDTLNKTQGIADLRTTQVRGTTPMQFSLSFQWVGGTDVL